MGSRFSQIVAACAVAGGCFAGAGPASAAVPATLRESCAVQQAAPGHEYRFCDDGVPSGGGGKAIAGGARTITVPAAYAGATGLPPRDAALARSEAGADGDGNVGLDADVSLPPGPAPAGGWPLVVMMHGCCAGSKTGWESRREREGGRIEGDGGEQWHYNNAWFAARGYAVLTYTSRGFVDSGGNGSAGETRIQSRRYEMNDMQSLVGQLVDDPFFAIDPQRIAVTGGSYGGGFSWLALTDPLWESPAGRQIRLAAVAPKYGWTDIAYTLIPNGAQSSSPSRLPAFDGSDTSNLVGTPKISILAGLYGSGKTGIPPVGSAHATFASEIDDTFVCLNGTWPLESSPLCSSALSHVLPQFLADNSAYYQQLFFDHAARDARYRVPVFDAGTLTDPLFPPIENHRMINRMLATDPSWPVQSHFGDVQHFVRNKRLEWTDVCAGPEGRGRCPASAYGTDLNGTPGNLLKTGTTTMLNRFIDHFARPAGNPREPAPRSDVTVAPEVCAQNATATQPADESGPRLVARDWAGLATDEVRYRFGNSKQLSTPTVDPHAAAADPVVNGVATGNACPEADGPAGPGVAVYEAPAFAADTTLVGPGTVSVAYRSTPAKGVLAARLYDLFPDGTRVLVDRAPSRVPGAEGSWTFELQGTVYTVRAGHRLVLELTQADLPFVKAATLPGTMTIESAELRIPSRPFPAPPPLVSPDLPVVSTDSPTSLRLAPEPGAAPVSYDVQRRRIGRRHGPWSAGQRTSAPELAMRLSAGGTFDIRVRATDELQRTGDWRTARTIVPSSEAMPAARYSGPWRRTRSSGAQGGRLRTCSGRRCELRLRYRGRDFALLARRSRGAGRALITVDGHRRAVSLRARRTTHRAVVGRRNLRTGTHSVRIRPIGRGRIAVDGFVIEARRPSRSR